MTFKTELEKKWMENAKKVGKTIVLPEAYFSERVLRAGIYAAEKKLAKLIFLTDDEKKFKGNNLEKYENITVINFLTSELIEKMVPLLLEKRKSKGLTELEARVLLQDCTYFSTMLVEMGYADGSVCGAETSSAKTFKPALQIIKGKNKNTKVSSFFVMLKNTKVGEEVFVFTDCGMNVNPTSEDLFGIAVQGAISAKKVAFIEEPRVALLSYSTKGSADGESVSKVRDAVNLLTLNDVDFVFDGELQLDAAIDREVAQLKCPASPLKGDANVLVFPDLQSGNIGYKLVQRFGGFLAFGPISQGMRKPINDVSRGATVEDIVITIAITALQAE